MGRHLRRQVHKLNNRISGWDKLQAELRKKRGVNNSRAFKKPGSMNPRKA